MNKFRKLISRYGCFSPHHHSPEIKWSHWDLLYLHSGELTVQYKLVTVGIEQGQSLLIPPDTTFHIHNGSKITTASVQYFTPATGSDAERSLKIVRNPYLYRGINQNRIETHLLELMELYNPKEETIRRQELLLELVLEKILTDKREDVVCQSPWNDLINRYKASLEHPPSIEELSHLAGYSPSRFRILFQKDMGLQPGRYFHNLKMERAAESLIETVLPIKKVALNHGYREVSHFNRAFTKYYRISPARYRKRFALRG